MPQNCIVHLGQLTFSHGTGPLPLSTSAYVCWPAFTAPPAAGRESTPGDLLVFIDGS